MSEARKPRRGRGRKHVLVERRCLKALSERVKGLIAAGSADAKSLAADFPLLLARRG
jgi:hypothetical protein